MQRFEGVRILILTSVVENKYTTGRSRANYRRSGSRSLQEAPVHGAQLESPARTIEYASGPREPQRPRGPKARFLPPSAQSRPSGNLSAAPPNFRIARRVTRAVGAIAALAVDHSGQARPVWPWTRAIQQCEPAFAGSLGGGHERQFHVHAQPG